MPKQPDLVEVEALEAFTVTRPYGQFHGDPASERNRFCKVPADAFDDLFERKKVKRPSKTKAAERVAEKAAADEAPASKAERKPRAAKAGADPELGEARKRYRAAFGRGAGPKWDVATIEAKIAEKAAADDSDSGDGDEADAPSA